MRVATMVPRRGWFAVVSIVFVACGSSDRPAVMVQDSAGVEIVTSSAPTWHEGEGWLLSNSPVLRLGVQNSAAEEQFDRVRGATRLTDGTIAVADGGSNEIRFFGEDGEFILEVGGNGGGPGEFARLGSIIRTPGDTVMAWDPQHQRLSVFSASGAFVRAHRMDVAQLNGGELVGRLGGGSLVLTRPSAVLGASTAGVHRSPRPFVRLAEGGSRIDTLAVLPGFEYAVTVDEGVASFEIPFARNAYGAVASDRVFVGSNDRFEIRQVDQDGELVRLIRYPSAERAVTEREVNALEAEVISYLNPSPNRRRNIERLFRETPLPPLRPSFSGMQVDPDGNLWVADWISAFAPPQRAPESWFVFDPQGRLLGSVAMPVGFRPIEIGSDYMLGVSRGGMEVERVDLYRLAKQREAAIQMGGKEVAGPPASPTAHNIAFTQRALRALGLRHTRPSARF